MGILFNDPDLDFADIYWYICLSNIICRSLQRNEGLISIDKEFNIFSCYVEIHRNGCL